MVSPWDGGTQPSRGRSWKPSSRRSPDHLAVPQSGGHPHPGSPAAARCGARGDGGPIGAARRGGRAAAAGHRVRARSSAGRAVGPRQPAGLGAQRRARRAGGPARRGLRGHQQRALRHAGAAQAGHGGGGGAGTPQPRRARPVAARRRQCAPAQRCRAARASCATRVWWSWRRGRWAPRRSTCRWWRPSCRRTRAPTGLDRQPLSEMAYLRQLAEAGGRRPLRRPPAAHEDLSLRPVPGARSTTSWTSSKGSGSPATSWWCGTSSSSATGRTSTARVAAARPTARSATRSASRRPMPCRWACCSSASCRPSATGRPTSTSTSSRDRREEVIQYVYQRYGRHHTAQVANVITYRARSSVRDMAKALGFAPGQQDAWSKQMDAWGSVATTGPAARPRHSRGGAGTRRRDRGRATAPRHPQRRHGDLRPARHRGLPGGVGAHAGPQRAAVGQGRLRGRRPGEVRPARPGHAQRAALRGRPHPRAPRVRGGSGHHPAGGRRVRDALPRRHGGRVPDRESRADGHAAAA
jgi:hypothetical protein